jgi:pSer/pThr/pTyr-binding forkhead associated (FHA) protein
VPHLILRPVHEPEREPQIVSLKPSLRIGRREDNDIVIADATISRWHIRFEHSEQGWHVFDNGSTSGIYINDMRCMDGQLLVEGDAIRIGGFLLTFCVKDAE